MKKITLPICSAKKGLKLILNSNKLKFEVKILYPNMMIINNEDLDVIGKILERNYINISY
jgi:hypothetical protein